MCSILCLWIASSSPLFLSLSLSLLFDAATLPVLANPTATKSLPARSASYLLAVDWAPANAAGRVDTAHIAAHLITLVASIAATAAIAAASAPAAADATASVVIISRLPVKLLPSPPKIKKRINKSAMNPVCGFQRHRPAVSIS